MKLLFAEDDPDIAKAVVTLLERSHYTVDSVSNGEDALDYIRNGDYDAAILDIMMPGKSGLEVVHLLRSQGCSLPIMMLTAMGELDDRVDGLEAGADDYLPKPFAGKELLARVKALLRRTEAYTPDIRTFGDICLDVGSYILSCRDKSVSLGRKEFQLMEMLLLSPQRVISADSFMEHIWGWDAEAEINVVFVNISYLRKKLAAIGSRVKIRVVRGAGYTLSCEDSDTGR